MKKTARAHTNIALVKYWGKADEELIQIKADLKASDLGSKEQHLKDLKGHSEMLVNASRQWRTLVRGLTRWEEDEYVGEYISNPLLHMIAEFKKGNVTAEQTKKLRDRIADEKENIESEYEHYNAKRREVQ